VNGGGDCFKQVRPYKFLSLKKRGGEGRGGGIKIAKLLI
jgi:hypothetical protein